MLGASDVGVQPVAAAICIMSVYLAKHVINLRDTKHWRASCLAKEIENLVT